MSDEPKKRTGKVLGMVFAILAGAFIGFWTAFALFLSRWASGRIHSCGLREAL
jgi:hypothetical protein